MDCKRARELINDYFDDDITAENRVALFGHINSCAGCADIYRKLRHQSELLAKLQPKAGRVDMLSLVRKAKERKRSRAVTAMAIAIPCAAAVIIALSMPLLLSTVGYSGMKSAETALYAEEAAAEAEYEVCEEACEEACEESYSVDESAETVYEEAAAEERLSSDSEDYVVRVAGNGANESESTDVISFTGELTDEKLEDAIKEFETEKSNAEIKAGEKLTFYCGEDASAASAVRVVPLSDGRDELDGYIDSKPDVRLNGDGTAVIDTSRLDAGSWSFLVRVETSDDTYIYYYMRADIVE